MMHRVKVTYSNAEHTHVSSSNNTKSKGKKKKNEERVEVWVFISCLKCYYNSNDDFIHEKPMTFIWFLKNRSKVRMTEIFFLCEINCKETFWNFTDLGHKHISYFKKILKSFSVRKLNRGHNR